MADELLEEVIEEIVDDSTDEEVIEEAVRDSLVITVPIDQTLSESGAAADALAVGNALETKASLENVKTDLSVNGRTGGGTFAITVNGGDIPASGDEDEETVAEALERLDTALGSEQTARQNADGALGTRIDTLTTRVGTEETARETADTGLGTRIDTLTTRVGTEETARQTADTAMDGRIGVLEGQAGLFVQIDFTEAGTIPVTDERITAQHFLTGCIWLDGNGDVTGDVLADLTWTTAAGSLTVVIDQVWSAGSVILNFGWRADATPEEVGS